MARDSKKDDIDLLHVDAEHPVAKKIAADKRAESITRFMHGLESKRKAVSDAVTAAAHKVKADPTSKATEVELKAAREKQAGFERDARAKLTAKMVAIIKTPANISATFSKRFAERERAMAIHEWVQSITDLEGVSQVCHYKSAGKSTASYDREGNAGSDQIKLPADFYDKTVAHELGHLIESRKPGVLELAEAFFDYRITSTKSPNGREIDLGKYSALFKGVKGVKGCIDHFDRVFHPIYAAYCGRRYKKGGERGTEIISMGLQALHEQPRAVCS